MNKLGVQSLDKSAEMLSGKREIFNELTDQHTEIKEVLRQFQAGYAKRNIEEVDVFFEELFINGEDTYAVGTGTGELFLGSEQVKTLIKDDWEGWGDVNIDLENAHIDIEGEVAWFATTGSVKYTFEDTLEKYDSHTKFIKEKAEETGLTPKQKITFINWFLSLVYHQRVEKKREYLWPMCLNGVLLKDVDKWKFVNLEFSMSKANFPDERFENSKQHLESYNNRNARVDEYKNNQMNEEIKSLLKSLETEFVGQKDISKELVSKYFAAESLPYIIGAENQLYDGVDQMRKFFIANSDSNLSLDLEYAIASKARGITWVTVIGTLKQELTEDELAERALEELENLFKSDITSKEKLFAAHRSMAYVLKESAIGVKYTCPLRLTAVILNRSEGPVFHHIHFSFPFYWIVEGKVDGI